MKRVRGFTLIELLVVVSIIALLIAILIPSLARAKESANKAVCGTNLSGIGKALNIYGGQSNDLFPVEASPGKFDTLMNEPFEFYQAVVGKGQSSSSINMFYCPSNISQSPSVANTTTGGNTGYVFLNDRWWVTPNYPASPILTGGPISGAAGGGASLIPPTVPGVVNGISRGAAIPLVLSQKTATKNASDTELGVDEIFAAQATAPPQPTGNASPMIMGSVSNTYSSHLLNRTQASGANILSLDNSVQWRPYGYKKAVYIVQSNKAPGSPVYVVPDP